MRTDEPAGGPGTPDKPVLQTRVQNEQANTLMNVAWDAAVEHLGGLDEHGRFSAMQASKETSENEEDAA